MINLTNTDAEHKKAEDNVKDIVSQWNIKHTANIADIKLILQKSVRIAESVWGVNDGTRFRCLDWWGDIAGNYYFCFNRNIYC